MNRNYLKIGKNTFIVDKYFRLLFREKLAPFGLKNAQGSLLLILNEYENSNDANFKQGVSQDVLISKLKFDKAVMTRATQALEKKALIERIVNPNDNRSFLFKMTQKGIETVPFVLNSLNECGQVFLKDISNEELEQVIAVLEKITSNISEHF